MYYCLWDLAGNKIMTFFFLLSNAEFDISCKLKERQFCMFFFAVCGLFFSKLTFTKKSFRITIRVTNSLAPDQARHFVKA